MNITNKKLLAVLTLILISVTPILFFKNFLCLEGFLSATALYSLILMSLIAASSKNAKIPRVSLNLLIILPLVYIIFAPVGMLVKSMEYGGFDFFINERLSQYIYLEGMALLILTFSAGLYAKDRGLYTGKLIKNLLSPLSIALCVRLFWMIVFESRHLRHFAMNMPHLKIEYIVLISIPLFTAILILILRRNLIGYRLGFIAGLSHFVLVCLMVIMKRNPGFGPIIVSLASLAICIFSVKGMREYYFTNKLRDSKVAYAIMRTVLKLRRNPVKIRNILELAGVKEGMKILDYGCGIGSYAIEAAKIAGKSGIVIAADRDDKMLQEVDRKTGKYGLSNIHVLQVTSPKHIKDKSFHFIFFIDALQFFKDQVGIINRLLEKLSPQGKLLIKFEHFRNDQIASLLDGCSCSASKAIYKKYWLLTK